MPTYSYDHTQITDKDRVRSLINDVTAVEATSFFSDEELIAVLEQERTTGLSAVYYASARCLRSMLVRFSSAGDGLSSKTVPSVSVSFGAGQGGADALKATAMEYETKGAEYARQENGATVSFRCV